VAVAKATKATDVEAFTTQTALVWGKMNNRLLSPHAALAPSPKTPLFMQPLSLPLIDTLLQKNWFIVESLHHLLHCHHCQSHAVSTPAVITS